MDLREPRRVAKEVESELVGVVAAPMMAVVELAISCFHLDDPVNLPSSTENADRVVVAGNFGGLKRSPRPLDRFEHGGRMGEAAVLMRMRNIEVGMRWRCWRLDDFLDCSSHTQTCLASVVVEYSVDGCEHHRREDGEDGEHGKHGKHVTRASSLFPEK